jgi:hypothetical protein
VRPVLYVLISLAVVLFFIVRQRRSEPFRERSFLLPLALGVYGAVELVNISEHDALTTASAALLVVSVMASIGFGVIRGRTIELSVRGGELWERASWKTIGIGWVGLIATRLALIAVAAAVGAKVAESPASIPIMLAITLAAQILVVRARAREAGALAD